MLYALCHYRGRSDRKRRRYGEAARCGMSRGAASELSTHKKTPPGGGVFNKVSIVERPGG